MTCLCLVSIIGSCLLHDHILLMNMCFLLLNFHDGHQVRMWCVCKHYTHTHAICQVCQDEKVIGRLPRIMQLIGSCQMTLFNVKRQGGVTVLQGNTPLPPPPQPVTLYCMLTASFHSGPGCGGTYFPFCPVFCCFCKVGGFDIVIWFVYSKRLPLFAFLNRFSVCYFGLCPTWGWTLSPWHLENILKIKTAFTVIPTKHLHTDSVDTLEKMGHCHIVSVTPRLVITLIM